MISAFIIMFGAFAILFFSAIQENRRADKWQQRAVELNAELFKQRLATHEANEKAAMYQRIIAAMGNRN